MVRGRARVTRRRSSYRSLASLQRDNRVCRACAEAGFQIESWPVLEGHAGQRAYIFGQAPGVVEGEERRPWRGDAGRKLRRWLEMDEAEFYATFYCASVTRCFPGRKLSGGGDREPEPREQELCSSWQEWEFRLLRPRLVLAVGRLAIRRIMGLTNLRSCVGQSFELDGAVVVPLPHSSGQSRWLNSVENQALLARALDLVRAELARLET
jgi:uracil-DNA glycosylase